MTATPKLLRLFALYENLCRFVNPWSTAVDDRPHSTTPITQGCNIIDITGVGLKQFWDLKSHLQDSSQLATAHYPETLDRIFVSHIQLACPDLLPARSHPDHWRPFVVPDHLELGQGVL